LIASNEELPASGFVWRLIDINSFEALTSSESSELGVGWNAEPVRIANVTS
jgi:hypothetical protein